MRKPLWRRINWDKLIRRVVQLTPFLVFLYTVVYNHTAC